MTPALRRGPRSPQPPRRTGDGRLSDTALQETDGQPGGGGTELLPALRQAFGLARARHDVSRVAVVATDGYVNVEREAFALIRERVRRLPPGGGSSWVVARRGGGWLHHRRHRAGAVRRRVLAAIRPLAKTG